MVADLRRSALLRRKNGDMRAYSPGRTATTFRLRLLAEQWRDPALPHQHPVSEDAFRLMVNLTSAMVLVPYLWWQPMASLSPSGARPMTSDLKSGLRDLIFAGGRHRLHGIYDLCGGLKFLLLSAILYALGTSCLSTQGENRRSRCSALGNGSFSQRYGRILVGIYGL